MKFVSFIKKHWLTLWIGFLGICLVVAFTYGAILDVNIEAQPHYDGLVVEKCLKMDYGIVRPYEPHVHVIYNCQYEGEEYNRDAVYYLSMKEWQSVEVGDPIEFDENNKPIFITKEGE